MALKFDLQNSKFGIPFIGAYAKVINFNGNKDVINYTVDAYASKEARDTNSSSIAYMAFTCPYPFALQYDNIIQGLYEHLKLQSGFENAEDC